MPQLAPLNPHTRLKVERREFEERIRLEPAGILMSREGFDVVTGESGEIQGMLLTYLVMSVITIFVCNTGGGGGGQEEASL